MRRRKKFQALTADTRFAGLSTDQKKKPASDALAGFFNSCRCCNALLSIVLGRRGLGHALAFTLARPARPAHRSAQEFRLLGSRAAEFAAATLATTTATALFWTRLFWARLFRTCILGADWLGSARFGASLFGADLVAIVACFPARLLAVLICALTAVAAVAAIERAVATSLPALEITARPVAFSTLIAVVTLVTILTLVAVLALVALVAVLALLLEPTDVGLRFVCAHDATHIHDAHIVVTVVTHVVDIAKLAHAGLAAQECGVTAALLNLLLTEGHDDAIVMLGVLQIALRQHWIAGRLRITGKRDILLGDMRRRAADFYVRTVALKAARQRILALAIASAATAVLLSLPHGLPFSIINLTTCSFTLPHPSLAGSALLRSATKCGNSKTGFCAAIDVKDDNLHTAMHQPEVIPMWFSPLS